ncbi:uncharacterized protein [Antedon mediterranea]|uniref:uncharacterized protein isoform X2 n=1 Tax=Antedon mediterranea TaxID=105859 RepID=UPI003AF4CD04
MPWSLIGTTSGTIHKLPQSMVFVGREDCDITIASRSVDKRHAVINYDSYTSSFTIKDIGSLNGTFVNETRIREQAYVNLTRGDRIRFGYDPIIYQFDQDNISEVNTTHQSKSVRPSNLYTRQASMEKDKVSDGKVMEEEDKTPIQDDSEDEEVSKIHSESLSDHESKTKYYRDILNSLKKDEMANGASQGGRTIQVISPARGSPLYGLPDWWGEKDQQNAESIRPRTGTFGKDDKDKEIKSPTSAKSPPLFRSPTSPLASSNTMTKHSTACNPVSPENATQDDAKITPPINHSVGFTIDFGNTKETTPKISLNDSLSTYMPSAVKTKINESVKIVEELKAERKQTEAVSPATKRRASKPVDLHLDLTRKKCSEVVSPTTEKVNAAFRTNSKKDLTEKSALPSLLNVPSSHTRRPRISKSSEDLGSDDDVALHIEDDHLSDTGTYTIESENPPEDLKKAREQICDVFGVDDDLLGGKDHLEKNTSGDDTDKDVDDMEDEDGLHHINQVNTKPSPVEPGTPTWVSQWASMASTNVRQVPSNAPDLVKTTTSSRESSSQVEMLAAFCITSVQIQDTDLELTKYPTFTRSPSDDSSPSPTSDGKYKFSKNKRMLPVVPGIDDDNELVDNQNGNFKHSENSPFQSPRNNGNLIGDIDKYGTYTKRGRKSRGSVLNDVENPEMSVEPERRPQVESKPTGHVWEKVNSSLDTECLLKDTEDYMKTLETRVRQKTFSTSPDNSEGLDASQSRLSQSCFDADESETSNVSNVEVERKVKQGRGRHQRSRSDFSNKDIMEEQKKDARKRRPSGPANSVTDSTSFKSSSIWSRLSTPYKHKVTTKDPETMSDTGEVSAFRRNSTRTASLPGSRRKSTSSVSQKEAKKKAQTPKLQRKNAPPLQQPRQTRSTMLRKSRFDDQDTSELSDVSPKSSISDLGPASYSKRPPISKSSTTNSKVKQVQSRVNCGQIRSSQGSKSARSDVSLGGQISQLAKTQLERERTRNQVHKQNPTTAKTNLQSKVNETKPTGTRWRRYESTGSETDKVDEYIKSVNSRKNKKVDVLKEDPRRRSSFGQRSQLEIEQRRYMETSIDDVASHNGTNDDHLSRGEGDGEAEETEEVAKDEKMLDEIFAENSTNVSSTCNRRTERKPLPPQVKPGKLYRPVSLEFDDKLTPRNTQAIISPDLVAKSRKTSKMEPFDNLLLASVSHLSQKLKTSSEDIEIKIRRANKMPSSNDHMHPTTAPLLKAGNQEIASILHNLRQVEKHLTEISKVIDSSRTSSPRVSGKAYKQGTHSKPRMTTRSISASAYVQDDDDDDMYF